MEGSKEFLYIKKINPPKTAIELLDLTFLPSPSSVGLKEKDKDLDVRLFTSFQLVAGLILYIWH